MWERPCVCPAHNPPTLPPPTNRDGLERVQVADTATLADLKAEVEKALGVPAADVSLSKDAALLTASGLEGGVSLLAPDTQRLADLGVGHGDLVSGEGKEGQG